MEPNNLQVQDAYEAGATDAKLDKASAEDRVRDLTLREAYIMGYNDTMNAGG